MTSPCRHGRLAGASHGAAARESRALRRAGFCNAPADTRKRRSRFHGCDHPHRSSSNQPCFLLIYALRSAGAINRAATIYLISVAIRIIDRPSSFLSVRDHLTEARAEFSNCAMVNEIGDLVERPGLTIDNS